jgi:hypothetical protein
MNILDSSRIAVMAASTALVCSQFDSDAQSFSAHNGDLLSAFSKTGVHQANYEVVVNIGNITNFLNLQSGSTIAITNYTPSQLSDAFSDYNFLQWSVSGSFPGLGRWAGFPSSTLWYTIPRANPATQSQASVRGAMAGQQNARQAIIGVGTGAIFISSNLGTSNADNNVFLVREPINDPNDLTSFIGGLLNATIGTFQDTLPLSVENTTSSSFTSAVVSDLYQSCPNGTTDPITTSTSGAAYFVGSFQMNPDGTMSFTRSSGSTPPPTPEPALLSVTRSGTISMISFASTNGATYTLFFTNSSGLTTPTSNWPSSPSKLTGNNATMSFQDTTSDPDRLYRVIAQ